MAFGKFKIFETDDDVVTTNDEEYYSVSSEEVKKGATGKMILVEPRAYSESQEIADHLKSRNSVVVNFKRVTNDQAKRIIDFLSGTLYAIGGDLQKIGLYLVRKMQVMRLKEWQDLKRKDLLMRLREMLIE